MSIQVLDPTHETHVDEFTLTKRLTTLKGATVGLLSNGKQGTRPFFEAFEKELIDAHGVAKVVRMTKKNYSAPAEPGIMAEAQNWDALIAGVGD